MVLIRSLDSKARKNVSERPTLEDISYDGNFGLPRTRVLYNMIYKNGPGYGTMLSLPFDQLVEHGIGHVIEPMEFAVEEGIADSRKVIELANKGIFSALALSIGQAEKYQNKIKPDLPLLVKVDGHLSVGKEIKNPRHSTMSSVERAVRAGADAIGFTFFIGGEETEQDMERVSKFVERAHQLGKPVFMWAYARGPLPEKMGADSLYWCAQGISVAESLGVDIVKQKFPMPVRDIKVYKENLEKEGYLGKMMPNVEQLIGLESDDVKNMPYELAVKRLNFCSKIAPNLIKIASGGPAGDAKKVLENIRIVMDGGWDGVIVGRNLWGRSMAKALELNKEIVNIMRDEKYHRILKEPRFTGKYQD